MDDACGLPFGNPDWNTTYGAFERIARQRSLAAGAVVGDECVAVGALIAAADKLKLAERAVEKEPGPAVRADLVPFLDGLTATAA